MGFQRRNHEFLILQCVQPSIWEEPRFFSPNANLLLVAQILSSLTEFSSSGLFRFSVYYGRRKPLCSAPSSHLEPYSIIIIQPDFGHGGLRFGNVSFSGFIQKVSLVLDCCEGNLNIWQFDPTFCFLSFNNIGNPRRDCHLLVIQSNRTVSHTSDTVVSWWDYKRLELAAHKHTEDTKLPLLL